MGQAIVPVPIFDLVALMGVQLKMVHSLANQYEVEFSENLGKSLISALIGGALPVAATTTMASVLKLIPGFGSLAGGASVAILGGALTYAIGSVFTQHFESGGTLLNFNPAKLKELFKKELKEGQDIAKELKAEQDQKTANA